MRLLIIFVFFDSLRKVHGLCVCHNLTCETVIVIQTLYVLEPRGTIVAISFSHEMKQ